LVAAQGWNAGVHDVETFTRDDPDALILAEVDGKPVGTVLATRWNESYGWIGMYIVDQAYRGRGIGLQLFDAALERLAPGSVGLDGDARQQENYRRSGFVDVHGNTRWHWRAGAARPGRSVVEVVDAREVPLDTLVELDARAVGAARPRLIAAWLAQPDARAEAVVSEGRAIGLVTARPARMGWKVGPLYAEDAEIAGALLATITEDLESECWLDSPDPNAVAMAMMRRFGAEAAPTSGRMTRGEPPLGDGSVTFALLAHEIG
jgi:hypothetical protein